MTQVTPPDVGPPSLLDGAAITLGPHDALDLDSPDLRLDLMATPYTSRYTRDRLGPRPGKDMCPGLPRLCEPHRADTRNLTDTTPQLFAAVTITTQHNDNKKINNIFTPAQPG